MDGSSYLELNSINLFEKAIIRDIPNDFIYAPMCHFHISGSIAFDNTTELSSNSIDASTIPEESSESSITAIICSNVLPKRTDIYIRV